MSSGVVFGLQSLRECPARHYTHMLPGLDTRASADRSDRSPAVSREGRNGRKAKHARRRVDASLAVPWFFAGSQVGTEESSCIRGAKIR